MWPSTYDAICDTTFNSRFGTHWVSGPEDAKVYGIDENLDIEPQHLYLCPDLLAILPDVLERIETPTSVPKTVEFIETEVNPNFAKTNQCSFIYKTKRYTAAIPSYSDNDLRLDMFESQ
jgi:hypothetical protein